MEEIINYRDRTQFETRYRISLLQMHSFTGAKSLWVEVITNQNRRSHLLLWLRTSFLQLEGYDCEDRPKTETVLGQLKRTSARIEVAIAQNNQAARANCKPALSIARYRNFQPTN
ncbi:hypothetical protein [Calothrix sp. NIES-2098]|uniref:hypothetical protein n=1 Tax=Calothrix sp. NIES-2098 TaxID=1954171 RepID=UPI000BBB8D2C